MGISYSSASARWLWVKSENLPVHCQKAQQLFEEQLITRLNELVGEAISFDGQLLSCDNDQCAQARLATAGGIISLFHKARCIKGRIRYELRLNDLNKKTIVYRSSFDTDSSLSELNAAGIELAERVVRGPKVQIEEKKEESKWRIGFSTGVHLPNASKGNASGALFQFEVFQSLSNPHLGLRYGLSSTSAESKYLERHISQAEFGFTYLSSPQALSTWFSFGLSFNHISQNRVEFNVESFNDQTLYLDSEENMLDELYLDSALWLETGLILTSGTLQPHLSMRISPLSVRDGFNTDLSILFGLRW